MEKSCYIDQPLFIAGMSGGSHVAENQAISDFVFVWNAVIALSQIKLFVSSYLLHDMSYAVVIA